MYNRSIFLRDMQCMGDRKLTGIANERKAPHEHQGI